MARSAFTDLKGPLSQALKKVALAGPAMALAPVWAEAVGAHLATRTRPVRLAEGTLTVEADPEFFFDLEREQGTLCARLNERLGRSAVRRLLFVKRPSRRPA